MKIDLRLVDAGPVDEKKIGPWLRQFLIWLGQRFGHLSQVLNGGLTFGDGVDTDNILGVWCSITTDPTPGTEFAVTHNAGRIPIGFLVVVPPTAGVINTGTTAWTTTKIYLTATSGSKTALLFLLFSPQTT